MKSLTQHINEKLVLNSNTKVRKFNYRPTSKEELKELIDKLIEERGNDADLNDIDVSKITTMESLFKHYRDFNGDISGWNVSNVTDMTRMFIGAESFNQPIGDWDVSKVTNMQYMFCDARSFNQDISNWKINKKCKTTLIFNYCNIKDEFKPKGIK